MISGRCGDCSCIVYATLEQLVLVSGPKGDCALLLCETGALDWTPEQLRARVLEVVPDDDAAAIGDRLLDERNEP
jgi:hypothetical protein